MRRPYGFVTIKTLFRGEGDFARGFLDELSGADGT